MFRPQVTLISMFSSIGLFKKVDCPEQPHCSLYNCIFAHHDTTTTGAVITPVSPPGTPHYIFNDTDEHEGPRKRRRLSNGNENLAESRSTVLGGPRRQPIPISQSETSVNSTQIESSNLSSTADREISPPPLQSFKTKVAQSLVNKAKMASKLQPSPDIDSSFNIKPAKKASESSLNPRMIPKPPASHAYRMQLITLLHEQMVRLNDDISQSQGSSEPDLRLSPQELILKALNEEERVARDKPTVYSNVLKLRITKLKKMQISEWKEERLKQLVEKNATQLLTEIENAPRVIETGLSIAQEISLLKKMLAKQEQLSKHGYVPLAPSVEDTAKTREGVETAQGWEQCDRCKTRFQVFPGRRAEDGSLTSGGTCFYHPAKPRRQQAKNNSDGGHKELMYACCNETIGTSAGCTSRSTHVFKVADPKRLALIMPFKETPLEVLNSGLDRAVCFDCEMGYTTFGMELIRLTATSWSNGEELLDILVRPLGEVLDLNSQFSGVWPKDFSEALPLDPNSGDTDQCSRGTESRSRLRLVGSPAMARDMLFKLLTPETPLIGHALDNDLNATRIIHPSIVDSVLLYPHPRGLPVRYGLKMLTKRHLNRDIQMGGANGHDSKEDARAAGELVRLKVADVWKLMRRDGWTLEDKDFIPPLPSNSNKVHAIDSYVRLSKA